MEAPCDLQFEGCKEVELEKLQIYFCGENALLLDGTTSSAAISRPNPNKGAVSVPSIVVTDSDDQRRKGQWDWAFRNEYPGEKLVWYSCQQSLLNYKSRVSLFKGTTIRHFCGQRNHPLSWKSRCRLYMILVITASTCNVGCKPKEMNVYDSVFSETQVICKLFNAGSQFHKQVDWMNCGFFATVLALKIKILLYFQIKKKKHYRRTVIASYTHQIVK